MLAKLDAYIIANDPVTLAPTPADTLAARSGLVSNTNTEGEFLVMVSRADIQPDWIADRHRQ